MNTRASQNGGIEYVSTDTTPRPKSMGRPTLYAALKPATKPSSNANNWLLPMSRSVAGIRSRMSSNTGR